MKEKITSLLSILNKRFKFPFEKKLSAAVSSFSKKEQIVFLVLGVLLFSSTLSLLWKVNQTMLVKVPSYGGSLVEGVVGTPRFINPLFAISDADRDVTSLVYSGLLRATENGVLENDLAERLEVSEDGLIYTFTLKDGLTWHDGRAVTADDVVFTIEKAQDPTLRSSKRASWNGVIVEKINDKEVRFILEEPYAPFQENATMGILPKHIWGEIDSEQFAFSKYNVEPIGSGPYKIKKVKTKKDDAGIPKYYDLVPFKKFAMGKPYISELRIRFYSNIDALLKAFEDGEVASINSVPPQIVGGLTSGGYKVEQSPFPRVFGVFFNQNQAEIFTEKSVRRALNTAINKEQIVNNILYGYATALNSPIPPGALGYNGEVVDDEFISNEERIEYSRSILEDNGWKFDEDENVMVKKADRLEFSVSTSDVPELKEVANSLKEQWEKLGARVEVKIFEEGSLKQNVIRPRKYDSLLFGEVVGRGSDLFAFWHSSQRLDPGLNIAQYANIATDKLLEDAREITDMSERIKKYNEFEKEVLSDIPAVFLYSPDFIYVLPKKIRGVELGSATTPSERFLNVSNWYIETDNVWKIFVDN